MAILFPEPPITKRDKLMAIRREIELRKRAYPHWVAAGKMSEQSARREIAIMQAIARDYDDS